MKPNPIAVNRLLQKLFCESKDPQQRTFASMYCDTLIQQIKGMPLLHDLRELEKRPDVIQLAMDNSGLFFAFIPTEGTKGKLIIGLKPP